MRSDLTFDIPSDWMAASVGDICADGAGEVQTGPFGSQLHASDYVDDGIPSVMPKDLRGGRIVESDVARITSADRDRLARYALRPGDIVYGRRGDIRRRALATEHHRGWLCGTGCLRVRPGDACDPRYLYYALGHPDVQGWIDRHAVGATMPNLNTAILSACPVPRPSLIEQRAISGVLGALDEKIDSNWTLMEGNERIASELLEQVARFGISPDQWGRRSFSDAIVVNPPVRVKKGAVTPFVEMAALAPFATRPERIEHRAFRGGVKFEPGDTLMARITGCIEHGKGAFVDFIDGIGAGSTEFIVMRPKLPLTPEAVFLLSRDPRFRSHAIASMTGTSGRQRVDVRCFETIEVAIAPPSPARADALSQLRAAMKAGRGLWREARTLTAIRDALLPKLVSGQIRIPSSSDPEEQVGAAVEALA